MCKTNGNFDTDALQRSQNLFELDESLWNDKCNYTEMETCPDLTPTITIY